MKKQKRIGITKKTRFEVFKRDGFTCQYCGRMAPDVVLEIDHINPINNGGTNDILNLVTSCFDCNRGKGKRKLSENSEIKKQQEQLKLLNTKREQLKLMIEWKKEIENFENEQIKIIESLFEDAAKINFTNKGKETIRKAIKKYGFDEVYESTKISIETYLIEDEKESINKAFNYIVRICSNRKYQKDNPIIKDINYLVKIVKNNYCYWNEFKLRRYLINHLTPYDIDDIKHIILNSKNWTSLKNQLGLYFETNGEF